MSARASRRRRKPAAATAAGGRAAGKPARPAPKSSSRRGKPGRARARRRDDAPAPGAIVEAAPPAADLEAPALDIDLAVPEATFAARVPPPEPERPFPAARRAIFFDVENTSRPGHIARVIDHLAVDRLGRRTDFVAVGNWKVIGLDTARLLARHGAQLVHSAPATGVRDWSDLRIAVAAGAWLAGARPGDVLEIVTNDRAFDAVGDVAAGLGIAFRRLSHEGLAGASSEPASPPPSREHGGDSRSRRRRRGRAPWRGSAGPGPSRVERVPEPAPPPALVIEGPSETPAEVIAEPHTAPHDEIIAVVYDLMRRSPGRPVTIDSLANALKQRGFSRPPGSPRLITRIRRIKEINLNRAGVLTLVGATGSASEPPLEPAPEAGEPVAAGYTEAPRVDEAMAEEEIDEGPDGNRAPVPAAPSHRRRSRRGRWRRRPAHTGAPAT